MHRLRIATLILFLFALFPVTIHAQDAACPETRLTAGGQATVTPGAANRLRDAASTDGTLMGEIPGGATFDVLEGPVCTGGFLWWRVDYQGTEGWTVEGNADGYFVNPVVQAGSATAPAATEPAPTDCALPPRLALGREGGTTTNTPSRLRDAASASGEQIGQIDPLAVFTILDGPVCADGINWWQVRMGNVTGWTAEGVDGEYLVEMRELQPIATPEYLGLPGANELSWSGDGTKLAVATSDGLYIFNAEDWSEAPTIFLDDYNIRDVAFNPADSNIVAVVQDDGDMYSAAMYDLETGEVVWPFVGERPVNPPGSLVFSANGSILSYNGGGPLIALDTEAIDQVYSFLPDDYTGGEVAYMGASRTTISPDGTYMGAYDGRPFVMAVGSEADSMIVFDRETIDAAVSDIAFSPDSTKFLISDYDGNLQMWDIETGVRTSFIRGAGVSISNQINALAFSPDGETLATAESDPQGVIRIYHSVNLRQRAAFSGGRLAEAALDVAFNPDGTLLAAIFDDTVRIVETTDYTQVTELVAGRN
jgi:WD40 repeat protein/uncharacterized protein YraI